MVKRTWGMTPRHVLTVSEDEEERNMKDAQSQQRAGRYVGEPLRL